MDILPLLLHATTAFAGALCGGAAIHWWSARAHKALQQRLVASEQARQSAVERSTQARAQIGQLSKALDELRQAQATRRPVEPLARAPAPAPAVPNHELPTLRLPPRQPPQAFADTRPM